MERNELIQLVFLGLVAVLTMLLIIAIVILVRNKDLIKENPILYGMKTENFSVCDCINSDFLTHRDLYNYDIYNNFSKSINLTNFNFNNPSQG